VIIMDEEEEIKRRKAEEYQKMSEAKKIEEQLKGALRVALDDSAYERLMNVQLANKQTYLVAAQNIIGIYKKVGRKITEDELLMLLRRIKGEEKEGEISFKRK